MARDIAVDLNRTAGETGGDAIFQPAVKGACVVVDEGGWSVRGRLVAA